MEHPDLSPCSAFASLGDAHEIVAGVCAALYKTGRYLISLGEYQQAIPWLTKATEAVRYEPRHFPWANLGRVYELLDEPERALENYLKAFEIAPDYPFALEAIERLSLPPERLN